MNSTTVTLSTFHTAKVQQKVARFNRAADKVGAPHISLAIGEAREVMETNEAGITEVVDVVADFTVSWTGEIVLPGGWRFLAAIDHLGDDINLVRPFVREDEEVAEDAFAAYFEAKPVCDHCGTLRERKMTVVIEDEDGVRKQVGTSCLRDFLGHDPSTVLWIVEKDPAADDEWFDSFGGRPSLPTSRQVLNVAAASVRVRGWVPKSNPVKDPTLIAVNFIMYPPSGMKREDIYSHNLYAEVTDDDRETVQRAFEWLADDERAGNSDYIRNLRSACLLDHAAPKAMGILVSLIGAYERAIGKEAERRAKEAAERARRATAAPVPVTDERVTIEGVVVKVDVKDGWGYNERRTVITVLDDNGFKVWGTAPGSIKHRVKVEDRVVFTARIERSDRDETFGFFSHPRKAEILAAVNA